MFIINASSIHGEGVFSTTDVPAGTLIGEYTGQRIPASVYEKTDNKDYMFQVNMGGRKHHYIDASQSSCMVRYINHHTTAGEPNAYAYQYRQRIFFRLLKDVVLGEEITVSYGKEYW
jgi:SET domain-containing protein